MINLFFDYNQKSQDLERSLKLAGYQHPSVVIQDNGFLPEGVESPLKYLLGLAGSEFTGRPRYFNEIDLPEFWEIKADSQGGEVLDHGEKRADIRYWKNNRRAADKIRTNRSGRRQSVPSQTPNSLMDFSCVYIYNKYKFHHFVLIKKYY